VTRRITLPLGESTTETHCGDCRRLDRDFGSCGAGFCPTLPNGDTFARWSHLREEWLRPDDCRAAEVKGEDNGAIIRLLALLVRAPTDDDGRPEIECSRETLVNMAMAARKELDALRAKDEDEEE